MRRIFLVVFVSMLMLEVLALWRIAANCTGSNCQCSDTLVANFTLTFDAQCLNVDQAFSAWLQRVEPDVD